MSVTIDSLPDEVLEFILSYVSPYGELEACSRTCKRWNSCCENVSRKMLADFDRAVHQMRLMWSAFEAVASMTNAKGALEIGKRYSHCASFYPEGNSMLVFGGCTSSATTFNDLWKFDLTSRSWQHVLTTGTYPSPKACASMVLTNRILILFGGWSYPAVGNRRKLFNELHEYDVLNCRWTKVLPASCVKPPTMAGHSATLHNGKMIVFGGLQKRQCSIGQFSSSSDVWSFDLSTSVWCQKDVPEPRPEPRYGQSQLRLDDCHLLVLGGCGGPTNVFNDVWLLEMLPPRWRWIQCRIENPQWGTHHMWCHPAVKVNNRHAVILDKNRLPKSNQPNAFEQLVQSPAAGSSSSNATDDTAETGVNTEARNIIPQLSKGVDCGQGTVRRSNHHRRQSNQQGSESSTRQRSHPSLEASLPSSDGRHSSDPRGDDDGDEVERCGELESAATPAATAENNLLPMRKPRAPHPSSVNLNQLSSGPRLQAFAIDGQKTSGENKQLETRQRQLEMLRRMEERYRNISRVEEAVPKLNNKTTNNSFACQRLTMHVLDISEAVSDHVVTWINVEKANTSAAAAPEETILYTLILGRGELIMFGGIQKDVSAMTTRTAGSKDDEIVSNNLHFLNPPGYVI